MNEFEIKASLIDKILTDRGAENLTLCTELPFSDGNRRADLVILTPESSEAFEIKSEKDSLEKLPDQLQDYKGAFNAVSVVVAKKHLASARHLIDSDIGILSVINGQLRYVRKPQKKIRLDKFKILSTLTHKQLMDIPELKVDQKGLTKLDLIELAAKRLNAPEIKEYVLASLVKKHDPKYKVFIKERGSVTTTDDLLLLSRRSGESLL